MSEKKEACKKYIQSLVDAGELSEATSSAGTWTAIVFEDGYDAGHVALEAALAEKDARIEELEAALKSHEGICALLSVPRHTDVPNIPNYEWRHMATRVEILVNGRRFTNYGGAMSCKKCGFGVDGLGAEAKRCPKCEADELGITMDEWYARQEALPDKQTP